MLFKKKNKEIFKVSELIYKFIVEQSRVKEFYSILEVPDTIDGRFELIALHFYFIENAINKENIEQKEIYNQILEIMYKDFDMNLREMGVGDLSVGKKIYHMTEAFTGRIIAYRSLDIKKQKDIYTSFKKNIYGTVKDINDKNVKIMINYFLESKKFIDFNFIKNGIKNSSVFLDLNRYIV